MELQQIDPSAFIHPSAQIYGKVSIGTNSSVWPNAVMRAENDHISIGSSTNIQDFVMLHVGYADPVVVGDFCSITHRATLHGCTVGDNCLIGIGAIIMDGAKIGSGSIVAGGTFIPEGKEFPPNSIIIGAPGKLVAERDNTAANRMNAWAYRKNGEAYQQGDHRLWSTTEFTTFFEEQKATEEQTATEEQSATEAANFQ
ncbi:MAG: carbonic anhydrase/acetyltransferase-like protein (isoleucine patch superfamily) [Acidimicrobiales bacterium]|jgi:carbonic anhydrase/acetyltransferase-like protein (isoleucine patch superfamily)